MKMNLIELLLFLNFKSVSTTKYLYKSLTFDMEVTYLVSLDKTNTIIRYCIDNHVLLSQSAQYSHSEKDFIDILGNDFKTSIDRYKLFLKRKAKADKLLGI